MRVLAGWLFLLHLPALAQSTQGIIAGRVTQADGGEPIAQASVAWKHTGSNAAGRVLTGKSGYYALLPLSPGVYVIRVDAAGFRAREAEVTLAVAGRVDLDFSLRPFLETMESAAAHAMTVQGGHYAVTLYGPDGMPTIAPMATPRTEMGLLDATRSQVIDPVEISNLPFFGRDVYTMLVTQPGTSSDGGTSRGLGFSVAGQRPAAANFLLDGAESNQYLLSGPLLPLPPEAIGEYRVSTSNFSAEYGFSAGYVANAVTRAGTNAWHGIGWWNWKNEAFGANGFQENRMGIRRSALREYEPGVQAGGPIRRDRYFVAGSLEYFHSFGHDAPVEINLPSAILVGVTAPDSTARALLERFPRPLVADAGRLAAPLSVAQPVTLDRWVTTGRFDGSSRGGAERFMARLAIAGTSRPDFIWSPYPDFISGLHQPATSLAVALTSALLPQLANELRFGWSRDAIAWDRAHPEVPTLIDTSPDGVILPGSLAFYAFRNRNQSFELADQAFRVSGRHILCGGGSVLVRSATGFLTAGQDGRYAFPTVVDFAIDQPSSFSVTLDRQSLPGLRLPQFAREYRYRQAAAFLQDTLRLSSRWTLNLGLRYEYFGAPNNTGDIKDGMVTLGAGGSFPDKLRSAGITIPSSGSEPLYRASHRDWSARAGFAHDLRGDSRTVLRGGWGIFYDRPFDNLWQNQRNNNLALATFDYQAGPGGYLAPIASLLPRYAKQQVISDFPVLTMFQPNWKTGYAMTDFVGIQQSLAENWSIEFATVASLGRRLITTDYINRPFSLPPNIARPENSGRSYNPSLPEIAYRGSQGTSHYTALTATLRYRSKRRQFYLAYTWSHAIDNQSDPLAGDFFDLNFAGLTPAASSLTRAAFSRQFDSSVDIGNADFDQRHNLVFYSIWDLPAPRHLNWLLAGWKFSQMAAFRSGFPFTVFAPGAVPVSGGSILNNRADIVNDGASEIRQTVPGGFQILRASEFGNPANGQLGSSGRNAFRGPGFYNVDVSLARSVRVGWLAESARLTLRADIFNCLNHANLGQPDPLLTSSTFGVALYGRMGRNSGFPALAPFRETPRQVQFLVRLEF